MTRTQRVVFLGASGFVGSHALVALRARDFEVLPVSSSDVNLRDESSATKLSRLVRDGDVVINAAAVVPAKTLMDVETNLAIVRHIVAGLDGIGLSQFIVVSSDAVYGDVSDVISSRSPVRADSYYGAMCVMRELAANEVNADSRAILRPTAVYGPGDTHNSYGPNRFIRDALRAGRITVFGEGRATRNHVSVVDIASTIVHAVEARSDGTFNVASGTSITFGDLARLVAELAGGDVRVDHVGSESDPTHRTFDMADIVKWFADFAPTPLEEGLAAYLASERASR